MQKIISSLEEIAHQARHSPEPGKAVEAIKAARVALQSSKAGLDEERLAVLVQLDQELSVWETKLPVIFAEPVGRQGVVKHSVYWAEKLRKVEAKNVG